MDITERLQRTGYICSRFNTVGHRLLGLLQAARQGDEEVRSYLLRRRPELDAIHDELLRIEPLVHAANQDLSLNLESLASDIAALAVAIEELYAPLKL